MPVRRPPAIVVLLTDQHRWDALGCVNPVVRTPVLDGLARTGIRFSQAVCHAPMCMPARHALMLGLHASQSGFRHNTNMAPTDAELPLPVLPQRLGALGYQTAGFGNTHWWEQDLFYRRPVPVTKTTRGFEVRVTAQADEDEPGAVRKQDAIPDAAAALAAEKRAFGGGGEDPAGYRGATSAVPPELHSEGWLATQAVQFIETGRDRNRPLFLYVSFNYPHAGFAVPTGYEDRYDLAAIPDRALPPWTAHPEGHVGPPDRWRDAWESLTPEERRRTTLRYWALVSFCDDQFGRILKALERTGELDDALVVFSADHGEMLGDRGHRFSKYCLYEGAVRVPLVLSGTRVPDDLRGTVDDRCAGHADLVPTLLAAAGAEIPPELPGRDLFGRWTRPGQWSELHGTGYEEREGAPAWMWRTKDWKLILYWSGALRDAAPDALRGELYDLRNDPQEWHNRYDDADHAAVRERLKTELLAHVALATARYPRRVSGPDL